MEVGDCQPKGMGEVLPECGRGGKNPSTETTSSRPVERGQPTVKALRHVIVGMDTILVPTDGSDNAEAAVDHAIILAQRFDATVHALYVTHVPSYVGVEAGTDMATVRQVIEDEGDSALASVERQCARAGVDVTSSKRTGNPSREITAFVGEGQADVVVMGTHGRGGVTRLLLGSVTETVLRRSDIPVLAVPKGSPPPEGAYEDILVATDASEGSRLAAEVAIEWAEAFEAHLHAMYVVDTGLVTSDVVLRALEGEGNTAVADVERKAEDVGLSVSTAIPEGVPHEAIRAYAGENDVDCIVLGSHGRDMIERAMLGSVSERTVRTAEQPVLVVPTPESP